MSESSSSSSTPSSSATGVTTPNSGSTMAQDLTGQTLGDFHILRRLGQGGMGQVYLAEQQSLRRKVALKILKTNLAADEVALKRFEMEAKAVARITHSNIVQVYAIGEGAGVHYMALEYVDGFNLREFLNKKGPPSLTMALSLMRQVASALARAAELGFAHRDIKPENILVTRKGEVKVADFGLSRCFQEGPNTLHLTQTGMAMGTPLYMSPEQVQNLPLDSRTDIYSFGATIYHLLAGQPPFRGETPFEVAIKHVQEKPRPLSEWRPDLPAELCALIDGMLAKDPAARPQTGRDILRELNRIREQLNSTQKIPAAEPSAAFTALLPASPAVAPTAPLPTPVAPASQPRFRWAIGLFALLAASAIGAALGWRTNPAESGRFASLAEAGGSIALPPAAEEAFLRKQLAGEPGQETAANKDYRLSLNLGLLYLEQNRFREANELFNQLIKHSGPARANTVVGWLGRAIVLAFEDRARESNQIILDTMRPLLAQPGKGAAFLNQPRLRTQLARAVERNRENLQAGKEPLPPELEPLRKPGWPLETAGSGDKKREAK